MEQPTYDLIIGNIHETMKPKDLDPGWKESMEIYSMATEVIEEIRTKKLRCWIGHTRDGSAKCDGCDVTNMRSDMW